MEPLTFVELLKISIVLPVLLVLSFFCFGATLERFFFYWKHGRVSGKLLDHVRSFVRNGHLAEAKKEVLKDNHHSLIIEAIAAQLDAVHLPRNERESLVLYYHQRLQTLLQKRLWFFGTLSFMCPLIGLFGTVLGVITAFRDLAISGSGGPTIVAAGISEALYATAGGILVAIIAAVIYNWFTIWMKNILATGDLFSQEIIFLTTKAK